MKPDVIVSWPRSCDYPLWRAFIERERQRFGEVIVVFTEHEGRDLSGFVRANFSATFLDSPPVGDRDWRDVAVNAALDRSHADWVWFTEQDFIIHDPQRFWAAVDYACWEDAIGIAEPISGRWHPACLFVRRAVIERRTERYFGPDPIDHFTRFGRQLGNVYDLELQGDLITAPKHIDFEHLQGVSQNAWLISQGEDIGVFRRPRYQEYLRDCLRCGMALDEQWADMALLETAV